MKIIAILLSLLTFAGCHAAPSTTELEIANVQVPTPPAAIPINTSKKKISKITPRADRVLYLMGEVGEATQDLTDELVDMGQSKEPIYLVIDSPGGSVFEGFMLISAMEASTAPIYTVCKKLCASMAAMIFEYGTKRYAQDRSTIMFHPASGSADGELDKMVSRLGSAQRAVYKAEAFVAKRAGLSFEQYKARASRELWLDGEDAVTEGFADKLVSLVLPFEKKAPAAGPATDAGKYVIPGIVDPNTIFNDVKWTVNGLSQ